MGGLVSIVSYSCPSLIIVVGAFSVIVNTNCETDGSSAALAWIQCQYNHRHPQSRHVLHRKYLKTLHFGGYFVIMNFSEIDDDFEDTEQGKGKAIISFDSYISILRTILFYISYFRHKTRHHKEE